METYRPSSNDKKAPAKSAPKKPPQQSLRPQRPPAHAPKPQRAQKSVDEDGFVQPGSRNGDSPAVKKLKDTCAAWMLRNRVRQPESKDYEVGGCVLFYASYETVDTDSGPKIQNRSCLTVGAVTEVKPPEGGITVRVIHSNDDIKPGLSIDIAENEIHDIVSDYAPPALIKLLSGGNAAGHVYAELIRNKHHRRYNNTLMNCTSWDMEGGKGFCSPRCYLPDPIHPLPPHIQIRNAERHSFSIESGWSSSPVSVTDPQSGIVGENAHIIADLAATVTVHKTKGVNMIMYIPRRWAVISEETAELLFKLTIPTFNPFPIDDDTPFANRHNEQASPVHHPSDLATIVPELAWYLTPQ